MMKVIPCFMLSTLILTGCGGSDGGSSDESSSVGKALESVMGSSNSNSNNDESRTDNNGNSASSNPEPEIDSNDSVTVPSTDNTDESTGSSPDTATDENTPPTVPDSSDSNNPENDNSDSDTSDDNNSVEPEPPVEPVEPPQSNEFADLMLHAVNQARSQQQNCGGTIMPAVPALTWDYDLESAAFTHSSDMANANFMGHTGSDGSDPGDRISATGYQFNAWAENVAAGQKNIDSVMAAWMASSGHCKNIMNATVTQLGASFVENPDSRYGIYWTQVFARPR